MERPVSILVVDDHALVRGTLARRLEDEPDMAVVASVGNADTAVAEATHLSPDIVLMDIDMPGLRCFDGAKMIQARCPNARIVFLSAFFHDRYIEQALAVKAWGYITKNEPAESVVQAIRNVSSGVAYYSPEVQARVVFDVSGARMGGKGHARSALLSDREMEVLRHLARGMSKKEIARTLHLSVHTVTRHTANLMDKLDIHDRVELARYAIREGLAEA